MTRYIKLTEDRLNKIVKECLNNLVCENKKTVLGKHYMHISQCAKEIPTDIYERALGILKSEFPDYDYFNCLMYDPKNEIVRFDYSDDFDTCTEPSVQRRVIVDTINGTAKEGKRGADVWHGKGNWWVDDDYKGFDVKKEKEWRDMYMSRIKERGEFGSTPHGESKANWLNHLIDLDLIDEYFKRNGITNPIAYLEQYKTGKFKNGELILKYENYKKNRTRNS